MTALMIYTERNDGLEMAKFLVENGADVNAKNDRMWGKWPLGMALAKDGNLDVAQYLFEQGADVRSGTLSSALKRDKELAMEMLATMDRIPSDVLPAVVEDDELFNDFIEKGADPSAVVKTCARSGNIECLRKLAEAGADPNSGMPLDFVKNAETARFLVEEMGADVSLGHPVHEAVMEENAELVRYLVNKAGADMNKQDYNGQIDEQTALHLAAFHQKFNMLKVLLQCDGPYKINTKNGDGNTVLDYIGTGNEHATPSHWKSEYKGVSRAEVRKMLKDKGALLSTQL